MVLNATGSGTHTTETSWNGAAVTITIPTSIVLSNTGGSTAGYSVELFVAAGAGEGTCVYTASDALTYTLSGCSGSDTFTGGEQVSTGNVVLSLTTIGSGGSVTVSLPLGGVPLTDGKACTKDSCSATGGATHTLLAAGTACSDNGGTVCSGSSTCNANGTCVAGTPTPTGNPNSCQVYQGCNPATGPYYAASTCSVPTGGGSGFDATVATNLVNSAAFLWSGNSQINTTQVSVVRGRVMTGTNSPVVGAAVTILHHPESSATTRSDGWFDIPVNGGGQVTVQVAETNYFTVQRSVATRWHEYSVLNDIWLTQPDTHSKMVTLNSGSYQTVKGSTFTNSADTTMPDGMTRTAQLLIPPSTLATYTYGPCTDTNTCTGGGTCNTTIHTCTSAAPSPLTMRATEYTAGANGLSAMPANLPANSAFTYAVELSADEATTANANGISFNNPINFYVENFLGFASASAVPVGYYDRIQGAWVPAPNGAVVGITGFSTSMTTCGGYPSCALLDTASQALGLPAVELYELSLMYSSAVSLWRFTTTHFSGWDANWGYSPPAGAGPPPALPPTPTPAPPVPNPCDGTGSIIECDNQILAQQLPLAGTPFSLRYQSDRAAGRIPTLSIPLTGATLPTNIDHVRVDISVAGVDYTYNFPATSLKTSQSFTWDWNQKDAYGDVVQGLQSADVKVSNVFQAYYVGLGPETWDYFMAYSPGGTPVAATRENNQISYTYEYFVNIGVQDAAPLGLGGWTLSANHLYDPSAHVLWEGNGKRRTIEAATSVIQTVAGSACGVSSPDEIPAINATFQTDDDGLMPVVGGPDGSYYVYDSSAVRHVTTDGIIHHFAGNTSQSQPCTGSCLAATSWVNPMALAVGPDSSVYVASELPNKLAENAGIIQKIDPQGYITTIAGFPNQVGCADGPLGTGAVGQPTGIAVAPDGSVIFIDIGCKMLRRVGTDGNLVTLGGTNTTCSSVTCDGETGVMNGDCGPVSKACFTALSGVAVAPDSTIYLSDSMCDVRRVDPATGIITTVLNAPNQGCYSGTTTPTGDGLPGPQVKLNLIRYLSTSADGTLYISDFSSQSVWSLDPTGIAHVLAGGLPGSPANTGNDNGGQAQLGYVPQVSGVGASPNGTLYVTDGNCQVRAIQPTFPGYTPGSAVVTSIPSEDGTEIYGFDSSGRHLYTYDGTTGATLLSFTYDPTTHQLTQVLDEYGNKTTINHSGTTVTVTPPFGQAGGTQQTVLTLDVANGHATTLKDPASESTTCSYSSGLMQSFKTAAGYLHQFTYDGQGNLLSDQEPSGSSQYLTRTLSNPAGDKNGLDWTVPIISGLGLTTLHAVTNSAAGLQTQTVTQPSGAKASYSRSQAETRITTAYDQTTTTTTMAPDPRYGMLDPYASSKVMVTPINHYTKTIQRVRTSTPSGPSLMPTALSETVTINQGCTPTPCVEQSSRAYASSPTRTWTYTSAAGRVRTETLNANGQITGVTFPGSQLANTGISYDANGRVHIVQRTYSGLPARTWTTGYDTYLPGYVYSTMDPVGNVTYYETVDNVGRPTNVRLPDYGTNPKSQYSATYDGDGNMQTLTVPPATTSSSTHTFSINNLDLLGIYEPPVDGLSPSQTSYTYTADDRIQSIAVPVSGGAENIAYNYDSVGHLWAVMDGSSKVANEFTYNSADQIKTAVRNGDTLTYAYDGFLKTSAAMSGGIAGTVAWTYDNFFRLKTQAVSGTGAATTVTYAYNLDDLFMGTSSPSFTVMRDNVGYYGAVTWTGLGTVSDTWGYDHFGDLATYTVTSGTTTPYQLTIPATGGRDSNGRIQSMTETINGYGAAENVTWAIGYDARGRIHTVTRTVNSSGATNTYTYDPNGNITMNGGTWAYDAQDRLNTVNSTAISFAYRNNGTATTKNNSAGQYTYNYDLSGLLRIVTLPTSGHSVHYSADAFGRRTQKKLEWSSTIDQEFVYDQQNRIVGELSASGATVTSVFVYGTKPNVPDYMIKGGKNYRIISDWVGSVRLVLDTSVTPATVMQQIDYDEFGNVQATSYHDSNGCPLVATTTPCFPFQPFGFAGGLWDKDTGLVRFGTRDYDPQVGRWISKDPIRFDGGDTNIYAYAGSDPVNAVDPSGNSRYQTYPIPWWHFVNWLFGNASNPFDTNFAKCQGLQGMDLFNCCDELCGGDADCFNTCNQEPPTPTPVPAICPEPDPFPPMPPTWIEPDPFPLLFPEAL
jgi:RHS repeat-associated protein